jgi:hypothetical protein
MIRRIAFIVLMCSSLLRADWHFQIEKGRISYEDSHNRLRYIEVRKPCLDLWVSPDESVIAFISVDDSDGEDLNGDPFVTKSTVYVARRETGFRPETASSDTAPSGFSYRFPKVLSDRKTVIVGLPTSATSMTLEAIKPNRQNIRLAQSVVRFCSIWNGPHRGEIIAQQRVLLDDSVGARCIHIGVGGKPFEVPIDCSHFVAASEAWSKSTDCK